MAAVASVREPPELLGPAWERTRDTLPEYNNHGDVLDEYWQRLYWEPNVWMRHAV